MHRDNEDRLMKPFKDWGIRNKLIVPVFAVVVLGGGGIIWALMEMHGEITNDALPEERALDGIRRASLELLSEYREFMIVQSDATRQEIDELKEEIERYETAFERLRGSEVAETPFIAAINAAVQKLKRIGDETIALRLRLLDHLGTMEAFEAIGRHVHAVGHLGAEAGDAEDSATSAEPAEDGRVPELRELVDEYLSELREYVLAPNDATRQEIAEIERSLERISRARDDDGASELANQAQDADESEPIRHLLEAGRVSIALTTAFLVKHDDLEEIEDELLAVLDEAGSVVARETDEAFEIGFASVAGLILAVLVMISLVGYGVTQQIAKSVTALANAAGRLGGGDLNSRADVGGEDEIGGLATAFNEMAQSLQETTVSRHELAKEVDERKRSESDLKKLKEGLEQMVDERTTELREAQESLVRQERLAVLGQMSAVVSHELRNPLGTIRTSMITIADNTEGRGLDVEGAIERIVRNIKRCDGIIVELLDYTRDTAPSREPTDVDEWLGGVLDELEVPPGLSLGRDLVSGVEADIDRDRLRRAVINIYDNACQAVTGNGNGADKEVAVATRADGKRVEIQVTDSGPGIADDELGNLFEPLYSTKSFGIGLGLPVVKKIAEEHGGGVEISSEIGRGTRVTLWLPLTAPEQGRNETS